MAIKSIDNNQELYFNDKEDRLELGDVPPQNIPKYQEVTWDKDCILIAIVIICMLCYAKNYCSNILQVITCYLVHVDNTTKRMIMNLHFMSFLIIYKTI